MLKRILTKNIILTGYLISEKLRGTFSMKKQTEQIFNSEKLNVLN